MTAKDIICHLPYSDPFLFVDEILEVNDDKIVGVYTYKPSLDFYKGHFKDHPVTPGVILIETMAQIGLVCLGIYLRGRVFKGVESPAENEESMKAGNQESMKYNGAPDDVGLYENAESEQIDSSTTIRNSLGNNSTIAFTSSSIDFLKAVYPAEKVTVHAEKVYYRFNKLKCNVRMFNEAGELVCQGTISGMMRH